MISIPRANYHPGASTKIRGPRCADHPCTSLTWRWCFGMFFSEVFSTNGPSPKPTCFRSFLLEITWFLGGQKLYFSWFWGAHGRYFPDDSSSKALNLSYLEIGTWYRFIKYWNLYNPSFLGLIFHVLRATEALHEGLGSRKVDMLGHFALGGSGFRGHKIWRCCW